VVLGPRLLNITRRRLARRVRQERSAHTRILSQCGKMTLKRVGRLSCAKSGSGSGSGAQIPRSYTVPCSGCVRSRYLQSSIQFLTKMNTQVSTTRHRTSVTRNITAVQPLPFSPHIGYHHPTCMWFDDAFVAVSELPHLWKEETASQPPNHPRTLRQCKQRALGNLVESRLLNLYSWERVSQVQRHMYAQRNHALVPSCSL
jgi:hypothetical protein